MTKIMVITSVWQTYEYGYGLYHRTGSPNVTTSFTDFPSLEEAEAAVRTINNKDYGLSMSISAEIL